MKFDVDGAEEAEEASHQGDQRAFWMAVTNCMVCTISRMSWMSLAMPELLPAWESFCIAEVASLNLPRPGHNTGVCTSQEGTAHDCHGGLYNDRQLSSVSPGT